MGTNLFGEPAKQQEGSSPLTDKWVIPPTSVHNTMLGRWQDRKRAWLAHGIQSELGREGDLVYGSRAGLKAKYDGKGEDEGLSGTSIFDPVLCEISYLWYCPTGGHILDPFAGGSVRGIVAGLMGYSYTGIELREEQVEANRKQARTIAPDADITWHQGDSSDVMQLAGGRKYDYLFTCPPYGSLERYSDDPRDLSTMDYPDFIAALAGIMAKAFALLEDDAFATVVVGDFRDKAGNYHAFPADMAAIGRRCGLGYYNHSILVNAMGNIPVTTNSTFRYRKLPKQHQDVIGLVKGDPRKVVARISGGDDGDTD